MLFHRGAHSHISVETSQEGNRALVKSFLILIVLGLLQVVIVVVSGSISLFADTLHNFSDATTAIPLWIAFRLATLQPTRKFTYGYGRFENLAGIVIVIIILVSGLSAAYEAIHRFLYPQPITHLGWVVFAGIVGFLGNEWVARIRLATGRKINSEALISDGKHARIDSWTSLAVLGSAFAAMLGFPFIDTFVGLGISLVIFWIVFQSGKVLFIQLLDGVSPQTTDHVYRLLDSMGYGEEVIRHVHLRWIGHVLKVTISLKLEAHITVSMIHALEHTFYSILSQEIPAVKSVTITV